MNFECSYYSILYPISDWRKFSRASRAIFFLLPPVSGPAITPCTQPGLKNLPECLVLHDGGETTNVLAPDNPVVGEGEDKVDDHRAPNCHVVPHRPVLSVQGNLKSIIL